MAASIRQDREHLLAALEVRPTWRLVLCWRNTKWPAAKKDEPWPLTRDADRIRRHLACGGNLGLKVGPEEDLVIHDVDNVAAYAELVAQLGPLAAATVCTASGKSHCYTRWAPGIPGTLCTPDGEVVGEPRRGNGGQQMAICPPSQIDGRAYRFAGDVNLTRPLPEIPSAWLSYFRRFTAPAAPPPPRPVDAVTLADRFAMALQQPGARRRAGGAEVKFRCPGCAALGRDTAQDNARLFWNGRWGCAVYSQGVPGGLVHWQAIGMCLGVLGPDGTSRSRR